MIIGRNLADDAVVDVYLQLHQTVREQNALPGADVFEKVLVADREDPFRSLAVDPEGHSGPGLQLDSAFG